MIVCVCIVAYENDFDAIAISPPGYGNTTQIDQDTGSTRALFRPRSTTTRTGISIAGWVENLGQVFSRLLGYDTNNLSGPFHRQKHLPGASKIEELQRTMH